MTGNLGNLILTYDIAAGEALGKRESHTPKIEIPTKIKSNEAFDIRVSVGPHPNTLEHSIRWIELYFFEEGRAFNPIFLSRLDLTPAIAEPVLILKTKLQRKGTIHAMEYCNLHGLWSNKVDISLD